MIVSQRKLAKILGVHHTYVYRKTKEGKIPSIKLKNELTKYVLRDAMKAWYGDEDWKHYYHKYLNKKIGEMTKLMEED